MDNLLALSEVIKQRRHKLGLTQKQLAEQLDVSDKAVSKWERGESLPDISLLPQIALALDVSIDYLFSGTEPLQTANAVPDSNGKNNNTAVTKELVANRINTKYVAAIICMLFAAFFCFFGQIVVLGNYISIVNWRYRPMLYSFIIVAIYFVCTYGVKKHRLVLADYTFTGHLDKVVAVSTITATGMVLVFHYITDYSLWSFLGRFMQTAAKWLGSTGTNNGIGVHFENFMLPLCFTIYFAVVVANMIISEKHPTFAPAVIVTSAVFALMTILHTVYYCFVGAVILEDKTYLYGFWLETKKVAELLQRLNTYHIIYAVVTFVIAAGFVFVLKEKPQRKIYALCALPLWLYHSISAFCFINRNFDGIGSNFAQLKAGSVMLSLALIAAVPHIVMTINGVAKSNKG